MNVENPKRKNKLVGGSILFLILACILLCVILPYADKLPEKYGKEINAERVSRGLPIIPANWRYFSTEEKRVWENPLWDETDRCYGDTCDPLIIHYQKEIVLLNENTLKEADVYLGDAIEINNDGVVLERVVITCIYHMYQTDIDCSTDIRVRDFVYTGDDIKKAETILDKWGIPYP